MENTAYYSHGSEQMQMHIYISLLIIPCIIYYVTNKETLKWTVSEITDCTQSKKLYDQSHIKTWINQLISLQHKGLSPYTVNCNHSCCVFNLATSERVESEMEGAIETTLSDIFNLDYSAHFNH